MAAHWSLCRYGEVRVWGLPDGARRLMERREEGEEEAERMQTIEEEDEGKVPIVTADRALFHHLRSSSVSGKEDRSPDAC